MNYLVFFLLLLSVTSNTHRTRIDFNVSHCSDEIISILLNITFGRNIKCKSIFLCDVLDLSHAMANNWERYGNLNLGISFIVNIFNLKTFKINVEDRDSNAIIKMIQSFVVIAIMMTSIIAGSLWFTFNFLCTYFSFLSNFIALYL